MSWLPLREIRYVCKACGVRNAKRCRPGTCVHCGHVHPKSPPRQYATHLERSVCTRVLQLLQREGLASAEEIMRELDIDQKAYSNAIYRLIHNKDIERIYGLTAQGKARLLKTTVKGGGSDNG